MLKLKLNFVGIMEINTFFKTQIVELQVNGVSGGNTQNQIQFAPQTYLSGGGGEPPKGILSLETFTVDDCPVSPLGNALPTLAQLKTGFLTLYCDDVDKGPASKSQLFQQIPLISLHRVTNGTNAYTRQLFTMWGPVVIWEKSFVTLSSALGNTSNLSFLFNVNYRDYNSLDIRYMGLEQFSKFKPSLTNNSQ